MRLIESASHQKFQYKTIKNNILEYYFNVISRFFFAAFGGSRSHRRKVAWVRARGVSRLGGHIWLDCCALNAPIKGD